MTETTGTTANETTATEYSPVRVNLESLLEAGAHFGHKVDNWNPKMLPFIYGKRNDVYVINLDSTLQCYENCRKVVREMAAEGKDFLFVGTKDQARDIISDAAKRSDSYYVNNRWLGGMLTNFDTIKRSIGKMNKLEEFLTQSENPESKIKLAKKEKLKIRRDIDKLAVNLGGIREMRGLPDAIFIVDIKKDEIAVDEARKLHIPVFALVDTNTDPRKVNYPIPANDDSRASIYLIVNALADAIADGKKEFELKGGRREKDRAREQQDAGSTERETRGGKRSGRGGKQNKKEKQAETVETVVVTPTVN